jgi:hypothetical protein
MPRKGNTNALKHGLYAQRFTDIERGHLKKMPALDLAQEIALLRVTVDRITEAISDADKKEKPALYNSLTLALTTITGMVRTQNIITGHNSETETAILDALAEIRVEMGI